MSLRLSQFVLILVFSSSAYAGQTFGYFFGGGGDAGKEQTIYYPDLDRFSDIAKKKKWTTQYIHNGGHSQDDAWLKQNVKGKPKKFSVSEFNRTIEELKKKIENNEIKPKAKSKEGDQILIFLATHGEENEKGRPGHNIETNDNTINVLKLKELRDLADHKGIPLVVVDNSCHSGPTLGLASKNTCVVTMAAEDVAYAGDSFRFLEAMKTGKNLEEAFLKGRAMPFDGLLHPGQPQISTEEGKKVGDLMKSLSEDLHDEFDAERKSPTEWVPCEKRKTSLDDIEKLLAKINSEHHLLTDAQIQAYRKEIKAYRDQENAAIEKFSQVKKLDKKVCFKLNSGYEQCLQLSEVEFNEKFSKDVVKKKNDPLGTEKETLVHLEKIKKGSQYTAYKGEVEKLKKMGAAYKKAGTEIYEKSRKISQIEREIYSKKYAELTKKRNGKSNSCRDFKL